MPSCDIIIPVWNQETVTRKCLESISRHTPDSYGLIIIDNGSAEPARKYLDGLKAEYPARKIVLIRKEENVGFIRAVNEGIRASEAEYVCLLNNDTIVTEGWLDELISVMRDNPSIGVINPSSNTLGQKPVRGQTPDAMALSAAAEKGKFIELGACIGFCMVVKKSLIDEIGAFDEIFGMGNFEDTDFSMRAKKNGYICARALGAYVYHAENTSFRFLKKHNSRFSQNRMIYEARWGRVKRILIAIGSNDQTYGHRITNIVSQETRNGNWILLAVDKKMPLGSLQGYSNLKVWGLDRGMFYPKIFMKILFKKKRFDIVYTDDLGVMKIARALSFLIKDETVLI